MAGTRGGPVSQRLRALLGSGQRLKGEGDDLEDPHGTGGDVGPQNSRPPGTCESDLIRPRVFTNVVSDEVTWGGVGPKSNHLCP